jgi:hypothetical protein
MKILSPITHHTTGSRNLKKSLIKYGYDFEFVGIGHKWKGFIESKIKKILEYLLKAENDIYCVIDGYDILACDTPSILKNKYLAFNSPIVFGGEKLCFPYNGTPIEKYKDLPFWKARKYLNSGFYIGNRIDLIEMCAWAISTCEKLGINDDQKIFCLYANTFPNKVSIDVFQQMIFNTITSIDTNAFESKNNKIYIKSYASYPCFIHFPSIKSDGYSRYNKYGKEILGKSFVLMFGSKTWNFFANIPLYFLIFLITLISLLKFKNWIKSKYNQV